MPRNRETLIAAVFAGGILLVLGGGAWLLLGGTPASEGEEKPSRDTGGVVSENAPRIVDVPGCPFDLRLDGSFREESTEDSDATRLASERHSVAIKTSCRMTKKAFDREEFLQDTLDAVSARFEGKLEGKKESTSGPAKGWTTWRRVDGQYRMFNVLVVNQVVVTLHVFGPATPDTKSFNDRLLAERMRWPAAGTDAGTRPETTDADEKAADGE